MLKIVTVGFAGAFALVASPVFAQDADAPFSGFYIGAAGGYDVQENDAHAGFDFDRNLDGRFGDRVNTITGANAFSPGFCGGRATGANSPAAGQPCRNDKNSYAYYARVGLDHQYGPFVIGAVGEFGKSEITDSVSAFSTTPASYTMTRSVDWEGSVRGRVGYAANTTLFYGTFGGSYAKIDSSFSTTNTANAFATRGKDKQFGFTGGGGVEQKIGRNISVGLEYMLHQYRDDDFRVRATAGSAISGSPVLLANNPFVIAPNTTGTDFRRSDDRFRWHSIRGTVAFRF